MCILSNLSLYRTVLSTFKIPIPNMKYKSLSGSQVAENIIKATEFANLDPFRAVTHNKGIMNEIDAVCLAVGQDWRAVESGAHAYASLKQNENANTEA